MDLIDTRSTACLKESKKLHLMKSSYLGMIFTIFNCIILSLTSVIVKKMSYMSPEQLTLVNYTGSLVCSLPILVFVRKNTLGPKEHRLLLLVSCTLGATNLYLNFLAFRYLPLGEASIIVSTTPAVVVIGAKLFLKEPCGRMIIGALILTCVGMILSVNLPELILDGQEVRFTFEYIAGIASAIGSVIFSAGFFLTLGKLKEVHYSVISVYVSSIGIVEGCFFVPFFNSFEMPHCGWDSVLVLCVAVLGFAALSSLALAIQCEAVEVFSIVSFSLSIVIGLLFQVIFFKDYPNVYSYCGAVIVMIAVSLISLKKFLQTLPDESKWRIKLKFILL